MISRIMFAAILCIALTGCDEQKRIAEEQRSKSIDKCLKQYSPEQCALLYPPIFVPPSNECHCACEKPAPVRKAEEE